MLLCYHVIIFLTVNHIVNHFNLSHLKCNTIPNVLTKASVGKHQQQIQANSAAWLCCPTSCHDVLSLFFTQLCLALMRGKDRRILTRYRRDVLGLLWLFSLSRSFSSVKHSRESGWNEVLRFIYSGIHFQRCAFLGAWNTVSVWMKAYMILNFFYGNCLFKNID